MKKSIFILAFFIFSFSLLATEKITLKPDGVPVYSQPTDTGKKYLITIEGTYTMWPQFTDCHGVDAVYVYDVPQEEIDQFRWPPQKIKVGNLEIPFVELPHWVGDDKAWDFPPPQIGFPKFRLNFRKYTGFRIDDEPLPMFPFNPQTHRYQIEKVGTGQPFKFQILDSNYNILLETIVPRYEDNCGELKITIEEVTKTDIQICDVSTICKDGKPIGIKLDAGVFVEDTASIKGKRNILPSIDIHQLGIIFDGTIICDIDSIVCNRRTEKILTGIVIDCSGSMGLPISVSDTTIRMVASKNAISNFINNLSDKDSAFIVSFSDDITLDQDITNDKNLLNNAINSLKPIDKTKFYGALIFALNHISKNPTPNRFVIALTDGINNLDPEWSDDLKITISKYNIPVYIIALGFSNEPEEVQARRIMDTIAQITRGKVFDVYSASKLDSVYREIQKEITLEDCCNIYFKVPSCEKDSIKFIRLIYAPKDTILLTKVIKLKCADCSKLSFVPPNDDDNQKQVSLQHSIKFIDKDIDLNDLISKLKYPDNSYLKIFDLTGKLLYNEKISNIKSTLYFHNNMSPGLYVLQLIDGTETQVFKFLVY
jgi:Mg-chelatase subunit ChlD